MSMAKTATVTAFLSLSGILFLNTILNLSRGNENQTGFQESPKQNAGQPDEPESPPAPGKNSKAGIAQPEKLIQPPVPSATAPLPQRAPLSQINPLLLPPRSQSGGANGERHWEKSAIAKQQADLMQASPGMAVPESFAMQQSTRSSGKSSRSDLLTPATTSLKDIEGHWAQYYIEFLLSRNVIQGFPDGRFRPDLTVTATEFSSMIQTAFRDIIPPPVSYQELQRLSASRPATRAEAAALIYRTLMQTEVVPIVTSVQINGAVVRPGGYSLAAASDAQLGKGKNLPTVSRAIQQAGGLLSTGNLQQVEIHRATDMGKKKVIKVDVQRVLQRGEMVQDVVLQQDDKLVIPTIAPITQSLPQPPENPRGQAILPAPQASFPSNDPLTAKPLAVQAPETPKSFSNSEVLPK
jgi:hypothetical protein